MLIFGTLQGMVIAIILSLLGLAHQAAHPNVDVIGRKRGEDFLRPVSADHSDDETIDGLLILQPKAGCSLPMPSRSATASRLSSPSTSLALL